nr:hypothetical protein CFP56_01794 [Quercus suber]
MERFKTTSSGERDGGSKGRIEENTNIATKLSAGSVSNGGENHSGDAVTGKIHMKGVQDRNLVSRDIGFFPPTGTLCDLGEIMGFEDALSLVGWQAHLEKEQMEVSSPMKCNAGVNEDKRSSPNPTGKETARKTKAEANWKRIAREKGKNKSPKSEVQFLSVGSKRAGKLVFEEEGIEILQKKQCTVPITAQN